MYVNCWEVWGFPNDLSRSNHLKDNILSFYKYEVIQKLHHINPLSGLESCDYPLG